MSFSFGHICRDARVFKELCQGVDGKEAASFPTTATHENKFQDVRALCPKIIAQFWKIVKLL